MKKLIALMAALFIAAPAFAADNLEISGSFYVKGWDFSNEGFTDNNDSSYFEQRLRIQSKFKADDNTYVVLRTDLGEGVWGENFDYRHANNNNKELEVDRVFAVMDRDAFKVTAGLQWFDLGICEVVDNPYTGVKLDLKFEGVTPTLFVAKLSENGSRNDDGAADDSNLYAINLNFGLGSFDSNLFYALADDNGADATAWGLGFYLAGDLGMVNLTGEIATFGGDQGNVDFVGTQAYLKAVAEVTDMVSVGGELLYALGSDDKNEQQISCLSNDDSFSPVDSNTPADADIIVFGSPFNVATIPGGDGANAGVQGITLFGEVRPMKALGLGAKVGYFTPEDDDVTNVDSLTAFNAWVGYDLGSNTNVSLTYVLACPDFDDPAVADENWGTLQAKFQVKF